MKNQLFCLLIFYVIFLRVYGNVASPGLTQNVKINECQKGSFGEFKTNITTENLSNVRVARAKARRVCRENKRASWHQYVSKLNSRTTLKST